MTPLQKIIEEEVHNWNVEVGMFMPLRERDFAKKALIKSLQTIAKKTAEAVRIEPVQSATYEGNGIVTIDRYKDGLNTASNKQRKKEKEFFGAE